MCIVTIMKGKVIVGQTIFFLIEEIQLSQKLLRACFTKDSLINDIQAI
jgi:hypothetical protein